MFNRHIHRQTQLFMDSIGMIDFKSPEDFILVPFPTKNMIHGKIFPRYRLWLRIQIISRFPKFRLVISVLF